MCFRPATAEGGIVCPNCGKKLSAAMGQLPSRCPFCKTSLENLEAIGEVSAPAAPTAPAAPGAPKPPAAPRN